MSDHDKALDELREALRIAVDKALAFSPFSQNPWGPNVVAEVRKAAQAVDWYARVEARRAAEAKEQGDGG